MILQLIQEVFGIIKRCVQCLYWVTTFVLVKHLHLVEYHNHVFFRIQANLQAFSRAFFVPTVALLCLGHFDVQLTAEASASFKSCGCSIFVMYNVRNLEE